jgi:transposase InsO family protein
VQFTSWALTDRARASGLLPSRGSIGDCCDNAVIESFWGRVQTELLNRQRWRTRLELANALFEYLEVFSNRRRRHSSLGMLTPIKYELQLAAEPVARPHSCNPTPGNQEHIRGLRTHRGDSIRCWRSGPGL